MTLQPEPDEPSAEAAIDPDASLQRRLTWLRGRDTPPRSHTVAKRGSTLRSCSSPSLPGFAGAQIARADGARCPYRRAVPNTQDLAGRFIVITGATSGIGRAAAEKLASRGASLVLACRSEEKTKPVLEATRAAGATDVQFVPLDLGSFASVRECAARIDALGRPIDVLVNNAGLAGQRGATKEGFELAFGTNHLGHFLLTALLAPRLRAARSARIVNVASKAHYDATRGIDYDAVRKPTRSITGLPEYAVSKLANVLFTRELARRIGPQGVHSYSLHPGVVASDAWRRVPWPIRPLMKMGMISNDEGALTTLYCATSPVVASHDGRYYDECREKAPSPIALDDEAAALLWQKSVEFTGADLA
jgi:retinol dehydrogenase-12